MTDFVGEQLDILKFWKSHSCNYPIMTTMAPDILIMQVASEFAFKGVKWKEESF